MFNLKLLTDAGDGKRSGEIRLERGREEVLVYEQDGLNRWVWGSGLRVALGIHLGS